MDFYIHTFGCKVNQCDSGDIDKQMIESGFERSSDFKSSDIVIVNSCAVTFESVRKLRHMLNRVRKENPNCILVLTGCAAQADISEVNFDDIDIIVGNSDKHKVSLVVKDYIKNKKNIVKINPIFDIDTFQNYKIDHTLNKSRAFLKIEDGCNRFCSYCIIPYARGKVRSKSIDSIINETKQLAESGYKEIVLVGINLSCYGSDLGVDLADAVDAVGSCDGIERIRLGSLEPDLTTPELISRFSAQPKFCPQFHMSLQSGSDVVLKNMRRHYTHSEYLSVCENIRKYFPNATFTTDLMVGFPGETEDDFKESLKIIKEVKFLKVHVFPYSPRPGTLAAKFDNQIPSSVKSQRVRKAIEKSNISCKMVFNEFLGKKYDVLYENIDKNGFYCGYTKEYLPVKTKSENNISGDIVSTELCSIEDDCIIGCV